MHQQLKLYYCGLVLLLLTGFCAQAQVASSPNLNLLQLLEDHDSTAARSSSSSNHFIIGDITVEGNYKTKDYIVKRELPFSTGDSIYLPDLVKGFEIGRQQLMNTKLFNEAIISVKSFRGYVVDIRVEVKERWYIFPIPYAKAVDRNINEFFRQGVGIQRINYGFKFQYNNFTGRNDKLKIWLITGYTQQLQFEYEQPYADRTLKHGYKLGMTYSFNREINYATINNQQQFSDSFGGTRRWYAHIDYTYRPGLRTFNSVRLALVRQDIDSAVINANPKYFFGGKTSIVFPELSYNLNYYKVDYIPYPLKGWMGEVSFLKRGFSSEMNMWQFGGKLMNNWDLKKKWYFSTQTQAVIRLPFEQPFVNQRMFGFGDMYLRGLERYVVDGVAAFLSRSTLRKEIIRFKVPTHLKSKSHSEVPFQFYARVFGDWGSVYNKVNPENSLTNKLLYTYGVGLDMVSFYDFVVRFDYSFNQLGQNGVFLHIKSDF